MIEFANYKKEMFCNMCGKTCAMCLDGDEYFENEGLILAKVSGGYPSTPGNGDGALDDMTQYEFSICEFCLDFMFSNFVIPPKVSENITKQMTFVPAEKRVAQDEWREDKDNFYKRKSERDFARKLTKKTGWQ